MKKTLLGSILLCGILFFSSCKKDNSQNQEMETTAPNNNAVSISPKGYLNFNSTSDLIAFSKKLFNPNTKENVIADLAEKGFKNRKLNIASRNSDPASPYNLIFSSDGLLEVDNVIMKITDDDKFIYTLKEEYANGTTFNNLVNEVFDALRMNKINVDRNATAQFNFAEFMTQNPNGQQEALNNAGLRRPMFGTVNGQPHTQTYGSPQYTPYGNCQIMQCTVTHHTQYVFWINIDEWDTQTNCHFVASSGC